MTSLGNLYGHDSARDDGGDPIDTIYTWWTLPGTLTHDGMPVPNYGEDRRGHTPDTRKKFVFPNRKAPQPPSRVL